MTVRPARAADARALAAIVADVAAEDRWLLTEPPVDVDAFTPRVLATIEAGDDALFVLEHGDEAVGMAGVHATPSPGVVSLGMAVLPAARGRGGGRALLRAAVDHARAAGRHKLELEVFTHNAAAIAFYAGHGFTVEGLRRHHHRRRDGTLRSTLLMATLLSPGGPEGRGSVR